MDLTGSPSQSPVFPKRKRESAIPITENASARTKLVRLGRYRITGQLGQGGMGTVYDALDTLLKRQVAIKLLPHDVATNAEALARFLREAQGAARLNHANVVAVYDIGKADGTYYIVMERIEGGNAQEILRNHGPFHWLEATRILRDVCQGVAAAHQAGLIHRDIKPSNILRSSEGVVKLADFGLAKSASFAGTVVTAHGEVVGTPHYMSPEQSRCAVLDERSDIYSLGATYFALLTGRPPYIAAHSMQILMAHCANPVPDPREFVSEVPECCAAIIQKAMAKDRIHRHATVTELLADLTHVLNTIPQESTSSPTSALAPIVWHTENPKAPVDSLSFAGEYAGERTVPQRQQNKRKWRRIALTLAALFIVTFTAILIARNVNKLSPTISTPSPVITKSDWSSLAAENDKAIRTRDLPAMKHLMEKIQHMQKSSEAQEPGVRESLRLAMEQLGKAATFREGITEKGLVLGLDGHATSVGISPDDRWVVIGQSHGTAGGVIYDSRTGEKRFTLWPRQNNEMPRVHSIAVSHDSSIVAAACADNQVRLWNMATGKESSLDLGPEVIQAKSVRFSPASRKLVAGLEPIEEGKGKPYLKIWNLDTGKEPFLFKTEHSAKIWSVDFTTGGHQVASGSDDKRVVFWNSESGRIWREVRTGLFVRSIACSPQGRMLAVAGMDQQESIIQFWDYAADKLMATRKSPHGICRCLAFTRDGSILATGSGNRILLWNPETYTLRATLSGHGNNVTSLAFSADGSILVSVSDDQTLRFWDVARCLSSTVSQQ